MLCSVILPFLLLNKLWDTRFYSIRGKCFLFLFLGTLKSWACLATLLYSVGLIYD